MKKFGLVSFVLAVFFSSGFSSVQDSDHSIIEEVIERGILSRNPSFVQTWEHNQSYYAKNEKELKEILARIKRAAATEDYEQIFQQVVRELKQDSVMMNGFLGPLEELVAADKPSAKKGEISHQLKRNKLRQGIEAAQKFVEHNFPHLWAGTLPEGYSIEGNRPVVFGDKHSIYGDYKGIELKTAALRTLAILEKAKNFSELQVGHDRRWLDTSSFVHLTEIPENVNPDSIVESPYYYEDDKGKYLSVIHNGYNFNGHRGEKRYSPVGKEHGPHDCSSGVSSLLGVPYEVEVSTWDFLYTYRTQIGEQDRVKAADVNWQDSSASTLLNLLETKSIRDPQTDIRPGDVYVHRTFDGGEQLVGKGGHAAIVLGLNPVKKTELLTLCWNRALPTIDGYAIQYIDYVTENPLLKQLMIFERRGL